VAYTVDRRTPRPVRERVVTGHVPQASPTVRR
jgi:DHA1 family inner membrane transport protein